jgi:acyl carrier protein
MTNPSRAPEGIPGKCPTCGKPIRITPSRPTGEWSCPLCRALLWFVVVEGEARFYPHWAVSPRKQQLIAAFTAGSPDSLDFVELVMELEEEFGGDLEGWERKMGKVPTLSEWIDFIIRELPD